MRRLFEGLAIVLGIGLIGGLIWGLVFVALGEERMVEELFFRIGVIVGLNVLMLTTGFLLYHLAERRWKSLNRTDMEVLEQVCQCSVGNYFAPAILFIAFVMFLMMVSSRYEEYIEILHKNGAQMEYLIPWGVGPLSVALFYYLVRKKIFYSDRAVRLVPLFGKSRVYSWREIRKVLVRQQGRNRVRLKLITDGRTYVLKSKVYSEGWEDFADTLLRSVKTYNIPIRWDE